MLRILICTLALLLSHNALALSQVTATVDKNPVMVKESLILTIIADDNVSKDALDTSALQADFIVGGSSVSSQTSMVNFDTSYTTQWTTVLIPRRVGTIVIPALTIASKKTTPITLTVVAANDAATTAVRDLFITSEISAKDVYVQQLITLTVKLHFAAELKRGSLSDPVLEGASIEQVGSDKESQNIINGKRFRIIERTYAITPEQSGQLTLQSSLFSGEVTVRSNRRSNFLSFGQSKPVSVAGDNIVLNIRPIPEDYKGQWLPSELLTLHQEWQPDPSAFMVGEPITRTISLTAAGLAEAQLPKITMAMPNGLKVYPDQAQLHSSASQARLVSQKVRNFAIVASRPGTFDLPAITIAWWNTVTNRYQETTIAAQRIVVQPNPDTVANTPSTNLSAKQQPQSPAVIKTVQATPWLQWLFLALWLFTSFAWLATTLIKRAKDKGQGQDKASLVKHDIYAQLHHACKNNQGQQVLSLLPTWVNSLNKQKQPVASISEALRLLNRADISSEVNDLQLLCYSKQQGSENNNWQGAKLRTLIETVKNNKQRNQSPIALNLNP